MNPPKDRCPTCGLQLDENYIEAVRDKKWDAIQCLGCMGLWQPEELITEDDDYAWVL